MTISAARPRPTSRPSAIRRRRPKRLSKLSGARFASAPRRRRSGGKRVFRRFVLFTKLRPVFPGGGDEPLPELSINAFKLVAKSQAFGMDGVRKATQRRVLWYWRFSRDWRKVNQSQNIQPEKSLIVERQLGENEEQEQDQSKWYWSWPQALTLPPQLKRQLKWRLLKANTGPNTLHDLTRLLGPRR